MDRKRDSDIKVHTYHTALHLAGGGLGVAGLFNSKCENKNLTLYNRLSLKNAPKQHFSCS